MRPRKTLVLLARNEAELSQWRLVLKVRGRYRVLDFLELSAALAALEREPVDLALTTIPGSLGADSLALKARGVLLFDVAQYPETTLAQCVQLDGPVLAQRVLEAVKTLIARKRGPKPKLCAREAVWMERERHTGLTEEALAV